MTKLVLTAVVLIAGVVTVAAQSAGPASETTLGALLQEVRAMRAEMQRNSATSIRAQLLVSRQQLIEQRINMASRDLLQVQNEIAGVTQASTMMAQQMRRFDGNVPADVPPDQREEMRAQIQAMQAATKQQLQMQQQREADLRQQEQVLTATITEAQGQWSDLNNRLDALERELGAR